MCGIAGILHAESARPVAEVDLLKLQRRLLHRGPDGQGTFLDGPCGLAHTRLAVIDLSDRARQPMESDSGRFVVSYNGEIYNFRELRESLQQDGRTFRTTSDTEVILQLAEAGGIESLSQLEGMFAIALYDRSRGELLLMRDRLGIKPLFWNSGPDGLSFASEPKALADFDENGSPTPEQIGEYLAFRHLCGEESLLPGVKTLGPGEILLTDGRETKIRRWWTPESAARSRALDTPRIIEDAVRRQLVSDVTVGTFLSGGVDSALVTAFAADSLSDVATFTVGFEEPEWDERPRARIVSDQLPVKRYEIQLDPAQYAAGLAEATWHMDAPINHAHSVHLLALARYARERITVALTGEGSDELFAGYPRYRLFLLARRMRLLPALLTRSLARLAGRRSPRLRRLFDSAAADEATAGALSPAFNWLLDAAELAGIDDPGRLLTTRRAEMQTELDRGHSGLNALLELDRRSYMITALHRMDRMSMAAGLECRVPVLDESVVEHARGLAISDCVDSSDTKKPMRAAAAKRFGRDFAHAPKSGFGVPLDRWFREPGPVANVLDRLLGERRTRERGWFDADLALRHLQAHRAGEDRSDILWTLMSLELWARVCVDGEGPTAQFSD